jgi:hypothetical protein
MVPANPISFPVKNLQGLDGCKRMGLDDNLAIAMVFNTTKQRYTDLRKTFFWSSENQKKMMKNDEDLSKK